MSPVTRFAAGVGTGRLEVQYTGTDGSVWDLRRIAPDGSSVFLTNQGLQGLRAPDVDYFTRQGALTPGQVLTGTRAKERKVFLPLLIGVNLDPFSFLDLNDRWTNANAIGQYGTLRVTRPDGQWRELAIRFNDDGGSALDADPIEEGSDVVGWTYYADDPYWYGAPVPYSFSDSAQANFFNQDNTSTYAWLGQANASPSAMYVSGVLTRTNDVLNPGFTVNSATWTAGPSTTFSAAGVGNIRVNAALSAQAVLLTSDQLSGTEGDTKSGSILVGNSTSATGFFQLGIQPVSASGAALTTQWGTIATITAGSSGTVRVDNVTLQPGAVGYRLILRTGNSTTSSGATFTVDNAIGESATTTGSYFDGSTVSTSGATPFIIAPSLSTGGTTLANAGNVPAWLTYTLRGPIDSWLFTLAGGQVGSVPVPDGARLDVYTDPSQQFALLTDRNGVVTDVTPQLAFIDWRPVPPGQSVPLSLVKQGAGSVELTLHPRFDRGY